MSFRPPSGRFASRRLTATKPSSSKLAKPNRIFDYGADWEQTKERVKRRYNYTCQGCGWRPEVVWKRRYLHVHHRVPLSRGGSREDKNLLLLCRECHSIVHGGEHGHLKKWLDHKFK